MAWTIGFCIGVLAGLGLACILPVLALRLHAQAFRLWWRWRSRRRGGRPPLDPELIALIRRMSLENPLWGAPRIHGELLKLGFQLSQSSVSKYMIARRERLYAFVVLSHGRRLILHIEVTDRPIALWLASQIVLAFSRNRPLFLIRDNDRLYGAAFRDEVRRLGLDDRPTAPASPWQNGHVKRLIGSIRRECLDHQLIWNASHLRRVLRDYAEYYNRDRTHLALEKDSPLSRPVERRGCIVSRRVLGGLHRRYSRIPSE